MARMACRRSSPPVVTSSWVQLATRRPSNGHRTMSSAKQSRQASPSPSTTQKSVPPSVRRWTTSSLPPRLPTWPPAGSPDKLPVTLRPRRRNPLQTSTLRKARSSRRRSIFAKPISTWARYVVRSLVMWSCRRFRFRPAGSNYLKLFLYRL